MDAVDALRGVARARVRQSMPCLFEPQALRLGLHIFGQAPSSDWWVLGYLPCRCRRRCRSMGRCVCVCVCEREREREVWWDDDGRVMLHIRWCMHTWYIPTVCAYGSLSIVVGRYGLCMLYAPLCADRYCRMGNVSRYSVDLGFLRWWRLLGIW
jgi:hypothetical protein